MFFYVAKTFGKEEFEKRKKKKKGNSKLFMTKLFDEIMKLVLNYFKNNLLLILFIIEFRKIERKIRRDIQQ